jgi:uridine phosphorylase
MTGRDMAVPPILKYKWPGSPPVFEARSLLREARRQKGLGVVDVPSLCLLDPDGDIVRRLRREGRAQRHVGWPCYHTELDVFMLGGESVGIVGCAIGAPFAVLVAEELFASGCRLLMSLTSAGQISPEGAPPYFVVIDRALRDEGTSYHYAAAADFAEGDPDLVVRAVGALRGNDCPVIVGSSWTTDAPFRETAEAIAAARSKGVLAVEMEAAALYAFARATGARVLCLAHVTNIVGRAEGGFEKGEVDGTTDALAVLSAIVAGFASSQ